MPDVRGIYGRADKNDRTGPIDALQMRGERMSNQIPINCNRCGENLGQHLKMFTGATEILVDPTWCGHLCERADGDVCPGCGGVCGEQEPSDLDHPYYSCADCAGGA